jgi:hypothetical protein
MGRRASGQQGKAAPKERMAGVDNLDLFWLPGFRVLEGGSQLMDRLTM